MDVSGGLVITMPSEKELRKLETREYIEKYFKAVAPEHKKELTEKLAGVKRTKI